MKRCLARQPTSWPVVLMPKHPFAALDVPAPSSCLSILAVYLALSPSSDDWAVRLLILNEIKSPPLPFEKEITLRFPFDSTV